MDTYVHVSTLRYDQIPVDPGISTYDPRRKIGSHDDDLRFQTRCVVIRVGVRAHMMPPQHRLRLNCLHRHLRTLKYDQIPVDGDMSTYDPTHKIGSHDDDLRFQT